MEIAWAVDFGQSTQNVTSVTSGTLSLLQILLRQLHRT
jgi:hypothetical protein